MVYALLLSPLVYLLIAAALVLLPVTRDTVEGGLDFNGLETVSGTAQWQERFFYARDGGKLFYREVPGTGASVLVLLHGSGSEGRYFSPLARRLSEALDATVVVPDLRGHGRSMGERPGDIDYLGQFDDDLTDLFDTLSAQHPGARMVLAGHSSGGGLALRHGAQQPTQFDAYVLLAPYLGYQSPTVRENSGGWVQVSSRRYAGLTMLNTVGIRALNHTPVLFFNRPAQWNDPLQVDHYSYRLNQSLAPRDYRRELPAIGGPLMVIVGEEDEAFYAKEFPTLLAEYAPSAEFVQVPDTGHLGLVSNEMVAIEVGDWLREQLNQHGSRDIF